MKFMIYIPRAGSNTMKVNNWTITTRLAGTDAEYHIAKKEGVAPPNGRLPVSRVHTSKDINYLIKLCKERN